MQECSTQQKEKIKVILIDSGSANSIFKDVHFADDIRPAKYKLVLYTNAMEKVIDKEADVPGFGSVYFYNKMTTNLVVLKDLSDIERVQIGSGILLAPIIMIT